MPTEAFFAALRSIGQQLGGNIRQTEVAWGVIIQGPHGYLIGVCWDGTPMADNAVSN